MKAAGEQLTSRPNATAPVVDSTQALLLRGSVDFESLDAYRGWIANLIGRRNARRAKMVQLECAALQPLPVGRTTDYDEATVFVTSSSGYRCGPILQRFLLAKPLGQQRG